VRKLNSEVFLTKLQVSGAPHEMLDQGKCHCRINLCGSTLIEPSSIIVHVVRVGLALARSIRVGLWSILSVWVVLGSGLSIWIALRSILSIEIARGSILSIETARGSSLSIETARGSNVWVAVHVIRILVDIHVLPRRDQVLPAVAWSHLQVGPAVPAAGGCGPWDPRCPSICKASQAIGWAVINRGCSANG